MDRMVRPVQYARGLDGKLVAVEQGPHKGWAIGDAVFSTLEEANRTAGRINQKCYLEEKQAIIRDALDSILSDVTHFYSHGYDQKQREARQQMAEDIMSELFPVFQERSREVGEFLAALVEADQVYRELKADGEPRA